jgi:8-amino-7-oxononanoate synthase
VSGWGDRVAERCEQVAALGRWREPTVFDALGPRGRLGPSGDPVVSFASNDYLGLSHHPAVVEAAAEALRRWGTGAGASRLVTGSRPVHHELEAALAAHAGAEAAVVLPTGFAANLAVLTTFGEAGVRICSDEHNHASIIDGARLARAEVAVYRHGDVDHLRSLVAEAPGPVIVVSDSVFSMDGDWAPVAELAEVCRRSGALLVLDEAHAVLGPDPRPLLDDVAWVRVGTLSKTLGSVGGYAASSRRFVELLVNQARSYIFTTAPPPAAAAAALAALAVLDAPEGAALRERLRQHTARLVRQLPAGSTPAGAGRSPIVPVVIGSDQGAVAASATLLRAGLWVPAIRPPTVPAGTARLRVTLSADHREAEVDCLAAALVELLSGAARGREPSPEAVAPVAGGRRGGR